MRVCTRAGSRPGHAAAAGSAAESETCTSYGKIVCLSGRAADAGPNPRPELAPLAHGEKEATLRRRSQEHPEGGASVAVALHWLVGLHALAGGSIELPAQQVANKTERLGFVTNCLKRAASPRRSPANWRGAPSSSGLWRTGGGSFPPPVCSTSCWAPNCPRRRVGSPILASSKHR